VAEANEALDPRAAFVARHERKCAAEAAAIKTLENYSFNGMRPFLAIDEGGHNLLIEAQSICLLVENTATEAAKGSDDYPLRPGHLANVMSSVGALIALAELAYSVAVRAKA
jgi:hypothetical protein